MRPTSRAIVTTDTRMKIEKIFKSDGGRRFGSRCSTTAPQDPNSRYRPMKVYSTIANSKGVGQ